MQEYYVYVTIILFASIYCIIRYWERQSVVLEPNAFKYHIYLQHKLVHVGSYKNIYIRMIKKQSGTELLENVHHLPLSLCAQVSGSSNFI